MNKSGISAIVATVLVILITVAAISIIWVAILPMIKTGLEFNALDGRVSVVGSGGYTLYDATQEVAMVQVKREPDEGVMDRIVVSFLVDGNSVSSKVVAPTSGGVKTYSFDLSSVGEPESVSVAPIFVSGEGAEKVGSVSSSAKLSSGTISGTVEAVYEMEREYFYERSCLEVLDVGHSVGDGVYWINPDGELKDLFPVYCDMTTDGGGWTLVEMQGSGTLLDDVYWSPDARDVGNFLDFGSDPDQAARLSAENINSIWKVSNGYLQHRYANNVPGNMLTDIFDKNNLNFDEMDIALAIRGTSTSEGGFCKFYQGGSSPSFDNNLWKRYNSYESDGLWCTGVHTYSNQGCQDQSIHGPLGDSYGCNKVGQRTVVGHMWWVYNAGGTPCDVYGTYGCYGSRWIR